MLRCTCHPHPLLCIIPPYMLDNLSTSSDAAVRKQAVDAIAASAEARAVRTVMQSMPMIAAFASPSAKKNRLIHDVKGLGMSRLPGKLVRKEGDKAVADPAVNEAYDYSGVTYDFYMKQFQRNSLDGRGTTLISSVHLGKKLNNAFWNGQQMAYGDGDGQLFVRFTKSLDVVGHELTHGVISHECNLEYQDESGALNEHFADVFGVLISQWKKKHTAAKATWLVGKEIMGPGTKAKALRDFGPGKAYENDPNLGTDPQPKHLRDKFVGSFDNGGVHLNSGIFNHAFFLFAKALGGSAYNEAGAIWYETMRKLSSNSQFVDMVTTTQMVAAKNHGSGSKQLKALNDAWKAVGF